MVLWLLCGAGAQHFIVPRLFVLAVHDTRDNGASLRKVRHFWPRDAVQLRPTAYATGTSTHNPTAIATTTTT